MRGKITSKEGLRHVALAVAYIAVYMALGSITSSQWVLRAGLRLTCLLFLPYRYWPTLIFAEMVPMAKISIECYEQFGPAYAFAKLIPPSAYVAPIVWWCRSRLSIFKSKQQVVRMDVLLLCVCLQSLVNAARDIGLLAMTKHDFGDANFEVASRFFLGNFLGILTVVPLALVCRDILRETKLKDIWARSSQSRFVLDSVALLLPALALLTWVAAQASPKFALASRIALFLPVAWLALRHGWRGAAVGGTAASIAIAIITPRLYDPATLQAEVFISFTISTLLMLGARITSLNAQDEYDRKSSRHALQLAQQGLYIGELRMRHAADTIEQIATSVLNVQGQLLERLRYLLTPTEEKHYSKQVIVSKYEAFLLSNSLAPRALNRNGLSKALSDATLAHAFNSSGAAFSCEITGNLEKLSQNAQLAFYRLVCEAAAFLYEQATLSRVRVVVRTGLSQQGKQWVAMRMDGTHTLGTQDLMPASMAYEQFKHQVGATGLDMKALRDQALIYEGTAHLRSIARGTRLALLLHDTSSRALNRVN